MYVRKSKSYIKIEFTQLKMSLKATATWGSTQLQSWSNPADFCILFGTALNLICRPPKNMYMKLYELSEIPYGTGGTFGQTHRADWTWPTRSGKWCRGWRLRTAVGRTAAGAPAPWEGWPPRSPRGSGSSWKKWKTCWGRSRPPAMAITKSWQCD